MEPEPPKLDEDLCEKYFISQYLKRINGLLCKSIQPYSLPPGINDDLLPYLLNDEAFFLSQKTTYGTISPWCFEPAGISVTKRQPDPEHTILYDRLWEAFRIHPEDWIWVLNSICHEPFKDKFALCMAGEELEELDFDGLMKIFASNQQVYGIGSISAVLHQRLQELGSELGNAGLESVWNRVGSLDSPFTLGLRQYIRKKFPALIPSCLQASAQRLGSLDASRLYSTVNGIPDFGEAQTSLFFGTAGTGKTRILLELLQQDFGMYIISPGIVQTFSAPQGAGVGNPALLEPVRNGASKDTLSLWQSVGAAKFDVSDLDLRELSEGIVFARIAVFEAFQKLAHNNNLGTKAQYVWTKLQLNCIPGADPFDLAWRLVRLDAETYKTEANVWAYQSTGLRWYIDEVQMALESNIGKVLLENIWLWTRNVDPTHEFPTVLSGTSLRLEELKGVVEGLADPHNEVPEIDRRISMTYEVVYNFQKIGDPPLFWLLYKQHISDIVNETTEVLGLETQLQSIAQRPLKTRAGRPLEFTLDLSNIALLTDLAQLKDAAILDQHLANVRNSIDLKCSKFFGRYRWSTIFIEQILREASISIQKCGTLAQLSVDQAATNASQAAIQALWNQLHRIKDKNWAEDLYLMAIRADVFNQSSVVEDDTAQLVSNGIGLVEELRVSSGGADNSATPDQLSSGNKIVRVSLCEPLVVEAIMSFLQNEGKYETLMNRQFSLLQVDNTDQGSMGKIAEYPLTTKLDNMLRDTRDIMSTHRRDNFWNIISSARSVSTLISPNPALAIAPPGFASRYHGYSLHKSAIPQTADLDNKSLTILQWVQAVVSNWQRPNFLFPSKMGGPDLMFFLTNGSRMILCAIQFKTSPTAHQPANLTPGVETLTKWLGQCPFRGDIVLIFAAPSTTIPDNYFIESVKALYQNDVSGMLAPNRNKIYLCYIDRVNSESVWGATFQTLLIFMKGLAD